MTQIIPSFSEPPLLFQHDNKIPRNYDDQQLPSDVFHTNPIASKQAFAQLFGKKRKGGAMKGSKPLT